MLTSHKYDNTCWAPLAGRTEHKMLQQSVCTEPFDVFLGCAECSAVQLYIDSTNWADADASWSAVFSLLATQCKAAKVTFYHFYHSKPDILFPCAASNRWHCFQRARDTCGNQNISTPPNSLEAPEDTQRRGEIKLMGKAVNGKIDFFGVNLGI